MPPAADAMQTMRSLARSDQQAQVQLTLDA
jgi:hypothetical protein